MVRTDGDGRGRAGGGVAVAAGVLVLGLVAAVTVVVGGFRLHGTETVSYPDEAVKMVVVTGDAADITVRPVRPAAPQLRLTRTVTSSAVPPRMTARLVDGRLTLEAACRPPGGCAVSYDLEVGEHVEAFRLHSTTGDITVTLTSGDVEAVADTGTVTLSNVDARTVRGVGAGDVRISCRSPSMYVGGFSSGGSVSLQVPQGPPYEVSAVSETGPVRVAVERAPHAPMQVVARTVHGAISVTH